MNRPCRGRDVVFVTSLRLQVSHRRWNPNTCYSAMWQTIPISVAPVWETRQPCRCPERLQGVDRPRLVFMGAIDAMLDLVCRSVGQRTRLGFLLIGPVGSATPLRMWLDCRAVPTELVDLWPGDLLTGLPMLMLRCCRCSSTATPVTCSR